MNYIYLTAYRVLGISHPVGTPDIVLWKQSAPSRRLVLTSNISDHFEIIDRQAALALMMMKGLIGKLDTKDFDIALVEHMSNVRSQRCSPEYPVVVLEAQGEVDAKFDGPSKDFGNFEVRWDVFDKDKIRLSHAQEVSASLAAIRMATPNNCRFEALGDGAHLIKPDGKIVHSITAIAGSMDGYVSKSLDEAEVDRVRRLVSSIVQQPDIGKVTELFSMSLERQRDRYQGFVTAWTALEILIGKLFRRYEKTLLAQFAEISDAPGLKGYLDRVEEVMNGKYTLVNRFTVLSIFLGGESAEEDITNFKICKEFRDDLFHGKQIPNKSLPLETVCGILDKYLCAFLESNA